MQVGPLRSWGSIRYSGGGVDGGPRFDGFEDLVLLLVGAEGGGVVGLELSLGFAGIVGGLESLVLFIVVFVVVVVCIFTSDGFFGALFKCADQSFASRNDLDIAELGEGAGSLGIFVSEGLLGSVGGEGEDGSPVVVVIVGEVGEVSRGGSGLFDFDLNLCGTFRSERNWNERFRDRRNFTIFHRSGTEVDVVRFDGFGGAELDAGRLG